MTTLATVAALLPFFFSGTTSSPDSAATVAFARSDASATTGNSAASCSSSVSRGRTSFCTFSAAASIAGASLA